VFFLSASVDLGLFWFLALMWLWIEIYAALLHRDLCRNGAASWPLENSFRDGAIAFALTAVSIFALGLLFGIRPDEAALAGGLCAIVVVVLGLFAEWLDRKGF
jgi:hypothetical protein